MIPHKFIVVTDHSSMAVLYIKKYFSYTYKGRYLKMWLKLGDAKLLLSSIYIKSVLYDHRKVMSGGSVILTTLFLGKPPRGGTDHTFFSPLLTTAFLESAEEEY